MRTVSLSALLVATLAATSVAQPPEHSADDRVSYVRDKPKPAQSEWIEVATPTPCAHGRSYVSVDAKEPFSQLRIAAHSGRPVLEGVKILFQDGTSRFVKMTRDQLANQKPAVIDLRGDKKIDMIIVDSDYRAKGSYKIDAAPQRDQVAKR